MYLWNVDTKLDPEDFIGAGQESHRRNYLGQGFSQVPKRSPCEYETILSWIASRSSSQRIPNLSIQGDYRLVSIAHRGKRSLYSLIKQYANRQSIDGTEFLVTAPEHALPESLTTRPGQDITDTSIVLRWLKKNAASLREDVFAAHTPPLYLCDE